MKCLATLLIVIVTTASYGQDKQSIRHLEKFDFDVIHASVFIDKNCPGLKESYEKTIEGELLRAKVTSKETWDYDELVLFVRTQCIVSQGDPLGVYDMNINFGRFRKVDFTGVSTQAMISEYPFYYALYSPGYGIFGTQLVDGLESKLKDVLRRQVSEALTDYLKANIPTQN